MTDNTTNLNLPYILAAQAQKHVTHNEAIRMLDAIIQLSVIDRDLSTPPDTPIDGARYLIADGADDAWLGHDKEITAFQDGAWIFYKPRDGWLLWITDEDALVVYNGTEWQSVTANIDINPTPLAGINTKADAKNRLSVSAPTTLLSHEGSNHQLKINKASEKDTASILFQTGFSGRAEIGLIGDNNLHIKVSSDGTNWREAMIIDSVTGFITFPSTIIPDRRE